jgi:membrane protease YdiL (CAAX protease family)
VARPSSPEAETARRIAAPLVAVLASLLGSAITYAALLGLGAGDDTATTLGAITGGLVLLGLALAATYRLPRHLRRLATGSRRPVAVTALRGALAGVALAAVAATIVGLGVAIDPTARRLAERTAFELPGEAWHVAVVAVAVVVVAPLGEELAFRALLLRALLRRLATVPAVLASAAVFAAAHGDAWLVWPRALALFAVGIGLAVVYRRSGLAASVAAHATLNAVAIAILLAGGD